MYGGKRTRTADPCRAKAVLYQLSYTPIYSFKEYKNILFSMWAIQDLNLGPHPYQGCTLTN